LLNACSHRGMEITRAEEGNQCMFTCPYHGWVFDSKGKLQGAPYERFMYGDWDKSEEGLGLLRARVGVQSGLIFGNFDQNAESLDDYLGRLQVLPRLHHRRRPRRHRDHAVRGLPGSHPGELEDHDRTGHRRPLPRASVHKNTMADMWPDVENPLSPISAALGTDKGHSLFRLAQTREEAQELDRRRLQSHHLPGVDRHQREVGGRPASPPPCGWPSPAACTNARSTA
jgi:Phenylpropionate dioxygenase and related ring-hydroxylating dioxygenases, large terminal subunit